VLYYFLGSAIHQFRLNIYVSVAPQIYFINNKLLAKKCPRRKEGPGILDRVQEFELGMSCASL
jgi:hypothetical protein